MRRAAILVLFAGCDGSAIVGLACREDRVECDGACVDVQNDRMNCGACGNACGSGLYCVGGDCVTDAGCPEGRADCGDRCVDPASDPDHCGACGVACADGEACQDGACVPGCDEGRTECAGGCVDVATDEGNCGVCGRVCGIDETCEDGSCTGGGPCVVGETLCGDVCTDLGSDEANCGGCGTTCAKGDACFDGLCREECPPGRAQCGDACVDLESDPSSCGACGAACADDEVCSAGACTIDCGDGLTLCGRSCVDLQFDPDHCGACDGYCDTGLCELGTCLGGEIGHWMLVGHDYGHGRRDQNRIVGNAVYVARGATVDVLVYEASSDAAEVENVYAALDQVAEDVGRSHTLTPYEPDALLAEALAAADVFLVTDQEGVGTEALEALGATWAEDLDRFLRSGGVLVVSDGGETWSILVGAGLAEISGASEVSGDQLDVTAAADAVAAGMPARYRAEETSVAYETEEDGAVVEAAAMPVVLHQVVVP